MDYAENSKLMEEDMDELKEFMFPLDDVRIRDFMLLSTEDQLRAGVTPGYVRLSVGIENIEDIILDIDQALNK